MSVPNIFYKLKELQIRQIQGSASLSLCKCETEGKTYTAGDLKSENSVNKLINLDEGFRVFRNLRGSPPYFERCKKNIYLRLFDSWVILLGFVHFQQLKLDGLI